MLHAVYFCTMPGVENIINKIKGKAILAPMLGTTDIPFRRICREYGAALGYTEMVSASGILHASSRSYRNAVFAPEERPLALQLGVSRSGDDELQRLSTRHPDVFDINCGCPNDRICEAGAGAQLPDDLPRFGAIIEADPRATSIPVSVKVRIRGQRAQHDVRDIVRTAQDSGAAFIAIHARARNVEYSAPAQWDALATAVSVARIPVVGNGDVFSPADALRMMDETGCTAVMVARGSLGTPWIFRDIADGHDGALYDRAPAAGEMQQLVRRHLTLLSEEFGAIRALPRMRKHALWYARRYEGFEALRKTLFEMEDAGRVIETAGTFFNEDRRALPADSAELLEREQAFRERVLFWARAILRAEG